MACPFTALSPDGNLLACPAADWIVEIYDVATAECLAVLEPPPDNFDSLNGDLTVVAFSPDSQMVAAGGSDDDHVVVVWNVATGVHLWSFPSYGRIGALQFSPDSTRLYSSGFLVFVSSCETGRDLFNITCRRGRGDDERSPCIALSRDGNSLATCLQNDIQLWDARTGSLHRILRRTIRDVSMDGMICACAFSPDARRIIVVTTVVTTADNAHLNRASFIDATTGSILGSLRSTTGDDYFFGCHFTASPFPRPSS